MLRNAEFNQPDWRLCQEGQEASFPISHIKPFARGNGTEPAHLTLACVLLPPAGNWVRFACQIGMVQAEVTAPGRQDRGWVAILDQ